MTGSYKTLKARFEFIDNLRLFLLKNGSVTARQVAEEFGITNRHAKEYMYALGCEKTGNQRFRKYTYEPSNHLLDLRNELNKSDDTA